jgi:hypothetical protein
MADTRLTKIGPFRALVLCAFAAFAAAKLVEAQQADDETRKRFPQPPPPQLPKAFIVRRGLWESLVWVLASTAVGYVTGKSLGLVSSAAATPLVVAGLQVFGAIVLLWGTLFVRGWDIQTLGGVTLTERVNRWLYRLLYCLGTAAIVASLTLT